MATVLIIEDDQTIAELEQVALEAAGYRVEIARDGPSGVLAAQRLRPDVIVLDVALPRFDGNAVLFSLDITPGLRSVPVLAVTAYPDSLDEKLRDHLAGVIQKPFDLHDLVALVERAAAGRAG